MSLDIAKDIQEVAHNNFTWQDDRITHGKFEDWRSADINRKWTDDCDGYAMSCVRAAVEQGIPKENLALACCWVDGDDKHSYHAVGLYFHEGDEDAYVWDCRYGPLYRMSDLTYKWDRYAMMDNPSQWKLFEKADE